MKVIYTLILGLLSAGLVAQDAIPNSGFENWTVEGGPFSSYLNPDGWMTLNAQTAILGIIPVSQASGAEAYAGDFALRLETNFIGLVQQMAPGLCVLGEINTQTQTVEGGLPIDDRPNALLGWFRYFPNGVDTGEVRMTLTKWDEINGTRDTVGVGTYYPTGTTENYTFFSAPVEYTSELVPDTMQLILVSGSQFVAEEGSVIYFDQLMLEYLPTGISNSEAQSIAIFPNPASEILHFQSAEAQYLRALDLTGNMVKEWPIATGQQTVSLEGLAPGQYVLQFLNASNRMLSSGRVVVIR